MSLIQTTNARAMYESMRESYEQEMRLLHPLFTIEQAPEIKTVFKAIAMGAAQTTYKIYTEIEAKNKDIRNYTTITNTKPLPASKSIGRATFQANTTGLTLLQNTLIKGLNGELYNLQDEYVSKVVTYTINSIESDGNGKITVITNEDILELATNINCNIAGVVDASFNKINTPIKIIGLRTLTYTKALPASTSSGGTISATVLPIVVESQDFGSKTEVINGDDIYLININTQDRAYVNFTNIIGGVDAETEASALSRTKAELAKPQMTMNDPAMETIAREYSGTTDAYVDTSDVDGTINVYHMRANSTPPFPTTQDNENLRNYLIGKALPSGLIPSVLVVQAPVQALYNIQFTFLPSQLKNQDFVNIIEANLESEFANYTLSDGLGQTVPLSRIESVITNAISKNYTGINPSLDAIINGLIITVPPVQPKNLPTLGTITYTP